MNKRGHVRLPEHDLDEEGEEDTRYEHDHQSRPREVCLSEPIVTAYPRSVPEGRSALNVRTGAPDSSTVALGWRREKNLRAFPKSVSAVVLEASAVAFAIAFVNEGGPSVGQRST